MDVNEAIELLESQYVENDIEKLSPKDRLNFWAALKEYQQPKIMRTAIAPDDETDTNFTITYADTNHKS